jgi:prefoldin subunit 5
MYGKYKFMESQLVHQKRHFLDKIPDMQSALDAIKFLASRRGSEEPITTRFELSDAVYARAVIDETEKVFVWLGANVMLEYTTEEAEALLTKNIASAKQTLASINTDLDFLKDQITVSEVNIARCHNYRVKLRQHKGDASGAGGKP